MHVLEDDRKSATELFIDKVGLVGALRFGWWEPYIEVGGKKYTWERIGDLLTWLDEGATITIKLVTGRAARRR